MFLPQAPLRKLGTPFALPDWRSEAVFHPERFGFQPYCSEREKSISCGFLSRMIRYGVSPSAVYSYPRWFDHMKGLMDQEQAVVLDRVWNKSYFSQHEKKITFSSANSRLVKVSWNLKKVKEMMDQPLRRLILHHFGNECFPDVEAALRFRLDKGNAELMRFINYACFQGVTDLEIAKKWRQPVAVIRAIRHFYCDYSHVPADRLAKFSFIRQLSASGELDATDLMNFSMINELGITGLNSSAGMEQLTEEEVKQVEHTHNRSMIKNLTEMRYGADNWEKKMAHTRQINAIGDSKSMRMTDESRRDLISRNAQVIDVTDHNPEDMAMTDYQVMSDAARKYDAIPQYVSVIDLKREEIDKIVIERSRKPP